MSDTVALYGRGKTGADGENPHLLGQEKSFLDVNYASVEPGIAPRLSESMVHCRWVKNVSGGVLLPGAMVKYLATEYGEHITAEAGAGDIANGVVDEYLPAAGVADNKSFWIVQRGPTKVIGGAVVAAGVSFVPGSSGEAAAFSTSGDALEAATLAGRAMELMADGTAIFRAFVNLF
jgi:hypothetical protein